jgi:hypothetical protein
MSISSRKLGPGQLELGAVPLEVNAQLTSCKVTPSESVTSGDAIKVLSGEQLDGDESATYNFVLEGTFLQDDPGVASVVDWSWDNMGTEQPFRFVPSDAGGREVSGTLTPVPLTIGGDEVDARMTSDFTWRIQGTPDMGPVGS